MHNNNNKHHHHRKLLAPAAASGNSRIPSLSESYEFKRVQYDCEGMPRNSKGAFDMEPI
jgi:hypothetical protein